MIADIFSDGHSITDFGVSLRSQLHRSISLYKLESCVKEIRAESTSFPPVAAPAQ